MLPAFASEAARHTHAHFQPFGRLGGTGPKAGGPRYLHRFVTERTLSIDTAAAGGNASLLSLDEGA